VNMQTHFLTKTRLHLTSRSRYKKGSPVPVTRRYYTLGCAYFMDTQMTLRAGHPLPLDFFAGTHFRYSRGSVVIKTLCYKPEENDFFFNLPIFPAGISRRQIGSGPISNRLLLLPLQILIPPTAPHSSPSIIRGWHIRPVVVDVQQPCPTRRPRYTFLAPSVSTLFEPIININSNFKTKTFSNV
jgi:hypothetical protein